jgi:hypothetical protein
LNSPIAGVSAGSVVDFLYINLPPPHLISSHHASALLRSSPCPAVPRRCTAAAGLASIWPILPPSSISFDHAHRRVHTDTPTYCTAAEGPPEIPAGPRLLAPQFKGLACAVNPSYIPYFSTSCNRQDLPSPRESGIQMKREGEATALRLDVGRGVAL